MDNKRKSDITRRGFIGAALVGVGGAFGWAVQKMRSAGRRKSDRKVAVPSGGNPFEYDLSKYETTDPALLKYRPAGDFATGFELVKSIATAPDGRILVAGDKAVRVFEPDGTRVRDIEIGHTPHCLHVSEEGELFVGLARHYEVFDFEGNRKLTTERFPGQAFVTAIGTYRDAVYVADAGNREVIVCDRAGTVTTRFGKVGAEKENPGFAIPSPYFDLSVTAGGRLWIANPGRLRVEAYSLSGTFESSWGEPGMKIERLSGCCNPVYFAIGGDGGFVTSEKGLARIKIYDAAGEFVGVVAGPDFLVDDKKLAKEACTDCSVGAGFDVAIDQRNWVHALDPFKKTVRSFAPLA